MSNKSDIYSYGMILYEMLTLAVPHMHVFPEDEDSFEGGEFQDAWQEAEAEYQKSLGEKLYCCELLFL